MTDKERINIYIDGGNFHFLALKKLGVEELNFSFEEFANFLADGREIVNMGKRFYIGSVREIEGNDRSRKAMSKQTKLFTILKSYNWEIKTSKLRTREEKIIIDDRVKNYKEYLEKGINKIEFIKTREKGIDVKLATDLIIGAFDDKYDTAIVVSSDTDLVPAIDIVRNRFKKQVEYIGFSIKDLRCKENDTKPIPTMIRKSDIQRIFIASDLQKFVKEFEQKSLFDKSN